MAAVMSVALVSTACGGTPSSASGSPSCSELAAAAQKDVAAVLDAHRSCTQASDCVSVELSASCFDSCTRAIRSDGTSALKAAQDKADMTQCAQFKSQGCSATIPPCAPPLAVTCKNLVCSSG